MSATTLFHDGPTPPADAARVAPLLRRYVGPPGQQVHLIEAERSGDIPLICLHATAYSARTFEAFLGVMGSNLGSDALLMVTASTRRR
jgi:hypothetical protein